MESLHLQGLFDHERRRTAAMRGAFSPTLRRDPHAALDFRREAGLYEARVLARRPAADRAALGALARDLRLPPDTEIVVAVPAHASEQGLRTALAGYRGSRAQVVVLVNASGRRADAAAVERAAAQRRDELAGLARVHVLALHRPRRMAIGTVRGLLADAVIVAAARAGLRDPVIVFNDADQLAVAPDYLARIAAGFRAPLRDLVVGPVRYGYHPDGGERLGLAPRAPELLLTCRYFDAASAVLRAGLDGAPVVSPEGANMALRLAALCAAGGVSYRARSGEDDLLGLALRAMRVRVGCGAPDPRHIHHDDGAEVVTDPRRVLRAILAGRMGVEAWSWEPFAAHPGASLCTAALLEAYGRRHDLLQVADIAADREKLRQRVQTIFLASSLREPRLCNPVNLRAVARRFGLQVSRCRFDRGQFRSLTIDWGRSPVVALLGRFARAGRESR